MHTIFIVYNNCAPLILSMNKNDNRDSDPQTGTPNLPSFFPRVIREFDDGPEEPLVYGGSEP